MKYENAKDFLPKRLFEELQRYAAGKLLYVPSKADRRPWGESTGYRKFLGRRNAEIRRKFTEGASVDSLADEYFLTPETVKKIVYLKKEKNNMELYEILRLYSDKEPVRVETLSERTWGSAPEQYLFEAAVTYPDKKIVLRVFCYCFATPERIAQGAGMIDAYAGMGYTFPKIVPNVNGKLTHRVEYNGYDCVVYAYEWGDGERMDEMEGSSGRLPCYDELLEIGAKAASLRLDGELCSCMALFDPVTACGANEDYTAEYVACDLKELVMREYPSLAGKYKEIARLFSENRDALRPMWGDLPSSLFFGDTWGVFVDGDGRLAYVTNFEDGGHEANLGYLFRLAICLADSETGGDTTNSCEETYDEALLKERIEAFCRNVKYIAQRYRFSDEEIAAAPYLWRNMLLGNHYYWELGDFAGGDAGRLSDFFDFLKGRFEADEIDFASIMR